jgi:hypothetical protein
MNNKQNEHRDWIFPIAFLLATFPFKNQSRRLMTPINHFIKIVNIHFQKSIKNQSRRSITSSRLSTFTFKSQSRITPINHFIFILSMSVQVRSVRTLQNNQFLLELRAAATAPTTQTTIVAICDESGSMCGAPFDSCLKALTELAQIQLPLPVILFASTARLLILRQLNDVKNVVQYGGGTAFQPAINLLPQILSTLPGLVEVIMFTDGQASDSVLHADKIVNERCRFHVIGLGSFSDTHALLEIRKLGYESGTFGFAASPADLTTKIAAAAEFSGSGAAVSYRGRTILIHPDEPAFITVDRLDSSLGETKIPIQPSTFGDEMVCMRQRLRMLAENPSLQGLEHLREDFNQIVEQKTSEQLNRQEYGTIIEFATALNDIAFLLRQNKTSKLSNSALALINERASEVVTRRFSKLADRRSAAGADRLAAQDTKLEQLAAEFAGEDLSDEPHFECALSRMSVAELISEGDCLCVGVSGAGKDVVIANPWLFRVSEITPTLVSFKSFAEGAYFTLKRNRSAIRDFSERKVADALTKGVAGETISGVLPLFISERHWRVASIYLDRASSMLICKDPLLGTYQHRLAAIFLSLQWIQTRPGSEFTGFLRDQFSHTLSAVWERRPVDFATPETFLLNVEKRLPPSIPDLVCMKKLWQTLSLPMEPAMEFYLGFMEENWRRNPEQCPNITIVSCGQFQSWLRAVGDDDAAVPTFELSSDSFVPQLPQLSIKDQIPLDEAAKWRLTAIVLQLKASESVGTMEWPTVRREFTEESAKAYVKELGMSHIERKRKDICASWAAGQHLRRRVKQQSYIREHSDDELEQKDFDFTSYLGRGQRHSRRSEVAEVLLEWVTSPRQFELAAKMKIIDAQSYIPSRRVLVQVVKTHHWITVEFLSDLYPSKADYLERMVPFEQARLAREGH